MKSLVSFALFAAALATSASPATAQSPPAQTSVTIGGKTIGIHYSAPSVRHRKIFGPGGLLSMDPTYPAWRAGANSATAFHTDATLDIGGLQVPKGDYTIYVWVADPDNWQLIINKETGQWGLNYSAKMDLGRVKMTMSKPPALIETYKMTLSGTGPKTGKLQLEWENHIASVPITLK
jgi:opacity protein-like surface antigen